MSLVMLHYKTRYLSGHLEKVPRTLFFFFLSSMLYVRVSLHIFNKINFLTFTTKLKHSFLYASPPISSINFIFILVIRRLKLKWWWNVYTFECCWFWTWSIYYHSFRYNYNQSGERLITSRLLEKFNSVVGLQINC